MRFAHHYFIALWGLSIGLIVFYLWSMRSRRAILDRFADRALLEKLLSSVDRRKQLLKDSLVFSSIFLLCVALMRPQWGFHWEQNRRKGVNIIVALDTSKSMQAQDIKPSRLERSKLAIQDFVNHLNGDRLGLIAFAGTAFMACPLTLDYAGFLLTLADMNTLTIPYGGTSISAAIREAVKLYSGEAGRSNVLIIITDGEDHEGDPIKAAQDAGKKGILIHCIGIGTPEGDLIQTEKDGHREFLKDRTGAVIKSKLDEELLKRIALTTGGTYIRASAIEFGLNLLYSQSISKMEKQESEGKMTKQYDERFMIPLTIALFFLIGEIFLRDRK